MDKTSRIPLYLQLMDEIIKKIDNQVYDENEQLPSERELCKMYDLSRITVRQAFQELEREGYIYKLHGKGTYVAPKSYNQKLVKLYSFTNEMKKLQKNPTTKLLDFEIIAIDDILANKMGLNANDEVYKIIRLRLADEEPLMYEITYLPVKFFPNLQAEELVKRAMYDIFQEDYRIAVTRAVEHFSATIVQGQEAKYLNMSSKQPAMNIIRSAYFHDQLIEYTISTARGDKFYYTVELT